MIENTQNRKFLSCRWSQYLFSMVFMMVYIDSCSLLVCQMNINWDNTHIDNNWCQLNVKIIEHRHKPQFSLCKWYCISLILGGDKIWMPTDKTISRGLFPRGAPIFFGLCTSPPSHQSIKRRSRSIPIAFLGWEQNLNADRQNHFPRAIPTRSANFFWALHIFSFIPIY